MSAIANRNGRSTTSRTSGFGLRTMARGRITTAVAAAASVPFSPTSIQALCTIALIDSGSLLMPPKSAPDPKARRTPSDCSVSSSRNPVSILKRGSERSTRHSVPFSSTPASAAATSADWVNSLSGPSGSSTVIASVPSRYGSRTD
ncbi:MAG TPA: hypothetical protein VF060_33045 [Trebonia sp.]